MASPLHWVGGAGAGPGAWAGAGAGTVPETLQKSLSQAIREEAEKHDPRWDERIRGKGYRLQ